MEGVDKLKWILIVLPGREWPDRPPVEQRQGLCQNRYVVGVDVLMQTIVDVCRSELLCYVACTAVPRSNRTFGYSRKLLCRP